MAEKSGELEIVNSENQNSEIENINKENDPLDFENIDDETNEDDSTDETREIRGQIEETRQQLGETIDAIQEKLSLSTISEQVKEQVSEHINSAVETAKDAVYGATIGKAGHFMQNLTKVLKKTNIIKTASDNPFPFLLIGIGAGLLIYNKFNSNTSGAQYRYKGNKRNFTSENERANQTSLLKSAQEKVSGAASNISNKAGSVLETVSGAAGSAYESVSGAATSAYKTVGSTASDAYDKVGNLKTQAREHYDHYIEDNPLAVGAVAAALGAAVALAIPSTNYENEWMGEAHDNLMSKAEDVARDAFEKVQQVAGEVKKSIGEEVRSQGSSR